MNEFDQFMKHELRVKYYARYTDDFVVVGEDKDYLEHFLIPHVKFFLKDALKLDLHPHKVTITPFHRGVDFLGYVIFPYHVLMRIKTRRRIMKNMAKKSQALAEGLITGESFNQTLQSYLGVLSHANAAKKVQQQLKNQAWFWAFD